MKYPKERRERENNFFFFFIFVFIYQYIINKMFINNKNTKHMKYLIKHINNILSIQKISFFASSIWKSMHCRSSRVYRIHGILHRKLRSYNINVSYICCIFLEYSKRISKICLKY